MGNSGRFPRGKPAATESRYPAYGACWVFQCLHNPPNSDLDYRIFNVRTNVDACDCTRGGTDTVRESALKADSGRKIPCRTGESNLPQRRAGPMFYQLSYILTPIMSVMSKCTCLRARAWVDGVGVGGWTFWNVYVSTLWSLAVKWPGLIPLSGHFGESCCAERRPALNEAKYLIVGAPQIISQPVSSILPVLHCPLGLGELQACPFPDVVFPPRPLSALSSSPFHCAFQDGFGQTWWTGDLTIPLQFASLYDRQEVFVWSDCQLDLGTDFLIGNMVFVWDA